MKVTAIIPDELVNYPVSEKDNIICPLVIDTEFTGYTNDFNKELTEEEAVLIEKQIKDFSIKENLN